MTMDYMVAQVRKTLNRRDWIQLPQHFYTHNSYTHRCVTYDMSGYKNFAVVGAGQLGNYLIRQLITDKAAGTINDVVVLTRQASLASAPYAPH